MAKQINPKAVNNLLEQLAIQIIKFNPDATYSASSTGDDMLSAVRLTIAQYGLTRDNDLGDIVLFRDNFEKTISKRYGVKFDYCIGEDLGVKYRKKRVPKLTQVKSGILDLLIGELNTIRVVLEAA